MARPRILVVDDEAPVLHSTAALLEAFDLDVQTHGESATIAERVAELQPDALLQDVRMPGLDVRALVRQLRRDPRTASTRIVLFSAGMELHELADELDVAAVEKPFKPQVLLQALIPTPA